MKKIILIIFLSITLISNVMADGAVNEVDFRINKLSYTTVSKKLSSDVTTFTYNNAILDEMNDTLLNEILKQVNPLESSDVIYYDNMQVIINPVDKLLPVKEINNIYIGQNASWDSNPKANEMAKYQPLTSNYPIYSFRIAYRSKESDNYSELEFNNDAYKTKTLKEKLAFLIGVSEDEVINNYNKLYKFVVPNNYKYTLRFDFYTEKDSKPVMSNDYYYTSSLKLLDTKYVVINYEKTETSTTSLNVKEEEKTKIIPAFIFFTSLIGGCYLLKKSNLINI